MKVVGLDTGTMTGWAAGSSDERPRFGCWVLSVGYPGDIQGPVSSLWTSLGNLVDREKPDLICFEQPMLGRAQMNKKTGNWGLNTSIGTLRRLYGLAATVELFCAVNDIPVVETPLKSVKKSWAGNGNANKEAMKKAARERGFDIGDGPDAEHIADALGVWFHEVQFRDPRPDRLIRKPGGLFDDTPTS